MIKWALLSKFDFVPRFELLSKFLNEEHGLANELSVLNCELEEFPQKYEQWKKEFDQMRVGPPYGSIIAKDLDSSNARTMTLQTSDCLHHLDDYWWPRSMLEEAFLGVMARSSCEIDIHAKAMVIGTGASARAVILPLIRMGYAHISFTDVDLNSGKDFVQELKKRVFNVKFDFIDRTDISLLPGSYSIVVNTTPDNDQNSLVDDLSYFNYLRSGGVAIDLAISSLKTKFMTQAKLVKAQTIPGYEIGAEVDSLWVDMCFDIQLNVEKYKSQLLDLISTERSSAG